MEADESSYSVSMGIAPPGQLLSEIMDDPVYPDPTDTDLEDEYRQAEESAHEQYQAAVEANLMMDEDMLAQEIERAMVMSV
jgi:hypothetical protein